MAEKLVFKIEAINKKFNDSINEASKKTENLEKNLTAVRNVAGVGFAAVTASIGAFIAQAVKIEQINTQFEVLTGSVLGAEKAVSQLQELSASTPFAFEDVAAAGKQLLGFGFEVDELTDRLNELGNVAAASGQPISDLSLIYGQVAAAGKLTGERLLQMQERAIPIGPALAKTMGVAEASIKDLVSQGKVDFETFQKAFASLSAEGGFAFGGLEKQSKTLGGQLSTLKDNFSLVATEIGNEFLPIAKEITTALIGFFQTVREDKDLQNLLVTTLKVGAVVTGLVAGIASLSLVFTQLAVVVGPTVGLLTAVGGAIFSVPVAIAALVAALGGLVMAWDSNLSFVENITENFAQRIAALFGGLGSILKGAFTLDLDLIKEGLKEIEVAFSDSGENIKAKRDMLAEDRREQDALEVEEYKAKQAQLLEAQAEADALKAEQKAMARQQALAAEITDENRRQAEIFKVDISGAKNRAEAEKKIEDGKVKMQENTFARLTQLSRSGNKTLAGIGKAAALRQVAIKTKEGATSAYSALAGIPYVGPFLGAAAAAALIAYGGEQARGIMAAKDGGLVTGPIKGRDSVPALLQPGELVTPERNFDEVVNAVASQRLGEQNTDRSTGAVSVELTLKDDLVEFIEAKIIERGLINTSTGLA